MGTSANNLKRRGRAAAKKTGGAAKESRSDLALTIKRAAGQTVDRVKRRVHDLSVNTTNSVVTHTKKKPVRALAIAAASGALLHAALKVITLQRD